MMNDKDTNSLERLWGEGRFRAFISHKATDKKLAYEIKQCLDPYGIASFVSHEDIEPMKEWVSELERALLSMDLLIALLTEEFSDSNWTDQEIGAAIGRGKLVIPVRMGKDPYGFIGKYQAIQGSSKYAPQICKEIIECLFTYGGDNDGLGDMGKEIFVAAVDQADSFSQANYLAGFLPKIDSLSPKQEESLIEAFNFNDQINRAYEFYPVIVDHLRRMTGNEYGIREYENRKHCLFRLPESSDDLPF